MKLIQNEEKYLKALTARIRQYADRVVANDLPASYAAFELLASIFSAHEANLDPTKLASAYPIAAWREDRIEIPRALLRPIVEGWMEYREADGTIPLGKAMDLDAPSKGASSVRRREATRDRNQRLSNLVLVDYLASAAEGHQISIDAAIAGVAEHEGVGYSTVEKAFKTLGRATREKLAKLEVKT